MELFYLKVALLTANIGFSPSDGVVICFLSYYQIIFNGVQTFVCRYPMYFVHLRKKFLYKANISNFIFVTEKQNCSDKFSSQASVIETSSN